MDKSLSNRLRDMILQGEFQPGERLTELGLASRLGISRTPIRGILPSLAAEGFLRPVGRRGFAVVTFSQAEYSEALELRGLLEGAAARAVARAGASPELLAALEDCLRKGDAIFEKGYLELSDRSAYGEMNGRFHRLVLEGANSQLLTSMVERLNFIPFVSPSAPVFDKAQAPMMYARLFRAHGHHHAIVAAIRDREAARAEALFREHANSQQASIFIGGQETSAQDRSEPKNRDERPSVDQKAGSAESSKGAANNKRGKRYEL